MVWFRDLFRSRSRPSNSDPSGGLHGLFKDYPPNPPQRGDDLAGFLTKRDARLNIIATFFRMRGVEVAPMLGRTLDGRAAALAVDAWLDENLPRRPFSPVSGDDTPNPDTHGFQTGEHAGGDTYYGFLADLGLLEGEAVRQHDTRFDWAVNRLDGFSDMRSFGRICLIKAGEADWAVTAVDMGEHMLTICHAKMAPQGNLSGRRFGELLEGATTGAFDPR